MYKDGFMTHQQLDNDICVCEHGDMTQLAGLGDWAHKINRYRGIFPWGYNHDETTDIWYLVGGLEHVLFFHVLGRIIPTDELIFLQRGRYTTNQKKWELVS